MTLDQTFELPPLTMASGFKVLLRYLFGALYENFKLLWDPMVELVQSYAKTMKTANFWDIFSKQLTTLSDSIGMK